MKFGLNPKKRFSAPLVVSVFLTGLARPAGAQLNDCQGADGTDAPCLKIDIPTVRLTEPTVEITGNTKTITVPFLAQYISGIYQYGLYAAVTVAGVMAVIGGFEWLTAGDSGRISKAKDRIMNAVIGVVLALGAFTLLNTINPDMVQLKGLTINVVAGIPITKEEEEDYGDNSESSGGSTSTGGGAISGGGAAATAYCKTIEECRAKCTPDGRKSWPTHTDGMLDPQLAITIPDAPGLVGNGMKASQEVIDNLIIAGASAKTNNMEIVVTSGYRPFKTQMTLVCNRMGDPEKEKGIGHAVAWPGGSNHGAGYAVDLQLRDASTKKILVKSGSCSGQEAGTNATEADSRAFDDLMFGAGFVRYQKEIWHYEYGSSSACRCSASKPCPAYPPKCSGPCS